MLRNRVLGTVAVFILAVIAFSLTSRAELRSQDVLPVHQAIFDITSVWQFLGRLPSLDSPHQYTNGLEEILDKAVLRCTYTKGPQRFFWWKKKPEAADRIAEKLEQPHPFFAIGDAASECPGD